MATTLLVLPTKLTRMVPGTSKVPVQALPTLPRSVRQSLRGFGTVRLAPPQDWLPVACTHTRALNEQWCCRHRDLAQIASRAPLETPRRHFAKVRSVLRAHTFGTCQWQGNQWKGLMRD